MDKRVEIHGASRADMNGKRGVATDFHMMDTKDRTTWRYAVKLDGGEAFKVKLASVRAEGAGGDGGGGGGGVGTGKAKGKGKKGGGMGGQGHVRCIYDAGRACVSNMALVKSTAGGG